jgi:hypothetical protein
MEALLNIDIWTCLASGAAIGLASIYVSSMLPDMSPPLDEDEAEAEDGHSKQSGKDDATSNSDMGDVSNKTTLNSEGIAVLDMTISEENIEHFDQADVDAFVAKKMTEKLIEKLPKSFMSEDEIRETVQTASAMRDGSAALDDEEINVFIILSWVLFFCVLGVSYYLIDAASGGDATRILRGFFPREFAFFARAIDKLFSSLYPK